MACGSAGPKTAQGKWGLWREPDEAGPWPAFPDSASRRPPPLRGAEGHGRRMGQLLPKAVEKPVQRKAHVAASREAANSESLLDKLCDTYGRIATSGVCLCGLRGARFRLGAGGDLHPTFTIGAKRMSRSTRCPPDLQFTGEGCNSSWPDPPPHSAKQNGAGGPEVVTAVRRSFAGYLHTQRKNLRA